MSAYALGRSEAVMQATHEKSAPAEATPVPTGEMKLVTALVDLEDADELRAVLIRAGAAAIVLSEASLYAGEARTAVIRGHRRSVEFAPRLRLEVLVESGNSESVIEALQHIHGASRYVQVGEVRLAATTAPARGGD